MLPFAFAPYNVFALSLVSLTILFCMLLGVSAKRAALRAWLFGLGMYGVGVSWVFVSIYHYGGVPLALSLFLTGLFVAFMSLFPALMGYLLGRFAAGFSVLVALLVIFPSAWVLQEWVRGWFLTGFPWLSIGYSQIEGPLVGFAPVLGVFGVSWLLAISSGAVAYYLVQDSTCRRRVWMLSAGVAIWLAGFILHKVDWVKPTDQEITTALLQGNISQDMKWLPEVKQPTIDLYMQMSRQNWDSDLIVWPETALPDFYHRADWMIEDFAIEAKSHDTDVLLGVLYLDQETGQYYNSMLSLADEPQFYHKKHLVPFTEYLPMKWLLGGLVDFMQVPMSDFSSGDRDQPLLTGAGYKIGISICFEDAFGEEVIWGLPEAAILVNVSNDAWFTGSIAPHQHVQMAQMRAIESGRPMLRATNTGVTAAFDHKGNLIDSIPQDEVGVLKAVIQPMQGMTPYAVVGNWLVVLLSFLAIVLAVLVGRKKAV